MTHTVHIRPIEGYDNEFMLENVKLAYPHIWDFGTYKGKKNTTHGASLLAPLADKASCKEIQDTFLNFAMEEDVRVKKLSDIGDIKFGRPRLKNGDLKEALKEWYEIKTTNPGNWPAEYINAQGAPVDVDPDTGIATDGTNVKRVFRAGTIVNTRVSLRMDETADGAPKLWVRLIAIQWIANGSAVGGGGAPANEGFGAVNPNASSSQDDDLLEEDDDLLG